MFITTNKEKIEISNQSKNPWKNGFTPTLFKFLIDKLAPIKNRVICNPFLARNFISVKVSEYCGKEELIYIATKKNKIK